MASQNHDTPAKVRLVFGEEHSPVVGIQDQEPEISLGCFTKPARSHDQSVSNFCRGDGRRFRLLVMAYPFRMPKR